MPIGRGFVFSTIGMILACNPDAKLGLDLASSMVLAILQETCQIKNRAIM